MGRRRHNHGPRKGSPCAAAHGVAAWDAGERHTFSIEGPAQSGGPGVTLSLSS